MKSNEILNLLRKKAITIPSILLKYYKELKISEKEMIFLAYLFSDDDLIPFNIIKFSNDLNFTTEEIMELMSNLCEKKLINMIVKKDNQDIMKEYIDISFLSSKLFNYIVLNKEDEEIANESDIYNIIEKEFGRTLSPIEYETIKQWLDAKIAEDLIKEALKEAVLNGVNNLKYIDKILFEWNKKGYKKPQDIRKKQLKEENVELFEYDWLKENE